MDRVSVCLATYNGERYFHEQLESIIQQLGEDDEIIISDDSSTDNTLKLVLSLNDARIKVFPGQKFRNPIFNFENAINQSTGDIIVLSDQDDIWHPDKVKIMRENLVDNDLVVCDCSIINSKGDVIVESYFDLVGSGSGVIKNLKKNTYFGCCMAFHRKILKKALPFPVDIPMHDIWLGFVADVFYKSKFIPKQLTLYRKHDSNASIASEITSNLSLFTKIKFRINILKYLPRLILR